MQNFLRHWLALVVLILLSAAPLATADESHPGLGNGPQNAQPAPTAPADAGDKVEKPPPTFAYFVAVVAVLVVLCLLCVPSRKAESSTARR